MKQKLVHVVIGIFIVFAALLTHDALRYDSPFRDLLGYLAFVGFAFAVINLILLSVPLLKKVKDYVTVFNHEKNKSKAHEDLLKYKRLLDENIISQEEFNHVSGELKAKILET